MLPWSGWVITIPMVMVGLWSGASLVSYGEGSTSMDWQPHPISAVDVVDLPVGNSCGPLTLSLIWSDDDRRHTAVFLISDFATIVNFEAVAGPSRTFLDHQPKQSNVYCELNAGDAVAFTYQMTGAPATDIAEGFIDTFVKG
jgi:hypothetical protein